jgi:5-carboxymethyl-2-hydroxymuconate isomerase
MKVGKGRTEAARQEAGATLFEALKAHLSDAMSRQTISLSLEMRELDPVKFNYRND